MKAIYRNFVAEVDEEQEIVRVHLEFWTGSVKDLDEAIAYLGEARKKLIRRDCVACEARFTPKRKDQIYCSKKCRDRAIARRSYKRKNEAIRIPQTGI